VNEAIAIPRWAAEPEKINKQIIILLITLGTYFAIFKEV
jgi:hypothetical protein